METADGPELGRQVVGRGARSTFAEAERLVHSDLKRSDPARAGCVEPFRRYTTETIVKSPRSPLKTVAWLFASSLPAATSLAMEKRPFSTQG